MNRAIAASALVVAIVAGLCFHIATKEPGEIATTRNDAQPPVQLSPGVDAQDAPTEDSTGTTPQPRAEPSTTQGAYRAASSASIESAILSGGALNDQAMTLLKGEDFDTLIDRLEASNMGVRNELASDYREILETTLGGHEVPGAIDRMACGRHVCVASIRTGPDDSAFNTWYDAIMSTTPLPITAMAEESIALPGGGWERRLIFTTDPNTPGAFTGMSRPPQPNGG